MVDIKTGLLLNSAPNLVMSDEAATQLGVTEEAEFIAGVASGELQIPTAESRQILRHLRAALAANSEETPFTFSDVLGDALPSLLVTRHMTRMTVCFADMKRRKLAPKTKKK